MTTSKARVSEATWRSAGKRSILGASVGTLGPISFRDLLERDAQRFGEALHSAPQRFHRAALDGDVVSVLEVRFFRDFALGGAPFFSEFLENYPKCRMRIFGWPHFSGRQRGRENVVADLPNQQVTIGVPCIGGSAIQELIEHSEEGIRANDLQLDGP